MKKFNVALDESKVERLRDAARRRAFLLKKNQTWVDLLREAADKFLADEAAVLKNGPADAVACGGAR